MLFEKQVKDSSPNSIEYVKTTDSKEQIETVNANVEKHPMGESEAPVTKAPEEEKIKDRLPNYKWNCLPAKKEHKKSRPKEGIFLFIALLQ